MQKDDVFTQAAVLCLRPIDGDRLQLPNLVDTCVSRCRRRLGQRIRSGAALAC